MFKKFSQEEISGHTQAKSSVHRNLRKKLLETYPMLDDNAGAAVAADDKDDDSGKAEIDLLMPKKTPLYLIKAPNFVQILVVKQQALFFNIHDGPWLPTLRTLHAYPELLPVWRCDAGAVRFLLNGSNVMAPGLTHPKASMQTGVNKSQPVAIYIDGADNACAIGNTLMSEEEVRQTGKGVAVEMYHHLGDGLWMTPEIETK